MANPRQKRWLIVVAILVIIAFIFYLIFKPSTPEHKYTEKPFEPKFKKEGELVFLDNENGDTLKKIDIEIADDDYETATGLMYRKKMREDRGMLFPFPDEDYRSFWMKNTHISLDIIFVNAGKHIVSISKNTTPFSETSIPSKQPAKYVIEVVAGFTNKYNVEDGDRIEFKRVK